MSRPKPLKLPAASSRQQTENRFLWNDSRSSQTADFFTFGYTGKPIEAILDSLIAHGVRTLIDIRQNPVSMYRPELAKVNLKKLVQQRGLHYAHIPELGVPRDIRAKAMGTGNREVIWEWYDEHVVRPYFRKNLDWFLNANEHPVALMCVELDPKECHRHRLFIALENMGLRGYDL
ncbi:MAG: DUF488 domain-containing protein [Nitrososphaera sp.]|nr:DUF488 domain-containing protein [Nitrososphaera sp.]